MKSVSLLAAALLVAGAANAQAPTNTYGGSPIHPVTAPANTLSPNKEVMGAMQGGYSDKYGDYSQDSYVSQTGSGNYATVDQVNTAGAGRGNTAILNQNGDNNNATQSQSATGNTRGNGNYYSSSDRNFAKSTQNGSLSQSNQLQSNGIANSMTVFQGAGTKGNRAIQTQGADGLGVSIANQAEIKQTRYATVGGGSGNWAGQFQTGALQTAKIDQEASDSYAKQTQRGSGAFDLNNAYIHQGDPGKANTALQTQDGYRNVARIQQSVSSTANNNYAEQNQTMSGNQADITQQSSKNYAEQQQSGMGGGGGYNYSGITQSNVSSAAYTTQSGNNNAVIITQH